MPCPFIGSVELADITTQHIKAVLDPIWTIKTETASRVRQRIEALGDTIELAPDVSHHFANKTEAADRRPLKKCLGTD